MSNPILVSNAFLLAASWINSMLFMLEIVLTVRYFQKSSRRPILHRLGVAAIFTFDTACTIAVCAEIYLIPFMLACRPDSFSPVPTVRFLAVILFTTYGTASLEQLFLCYLYFALTKNRVIAGCLVSSIAVHLAASYASAILSLKAESPVGTAFLTSKYGTRFFQPRVGAIACAVTDVMIACTLLHTFVRMEKASAVRVSTHSLLRRLMVMIFTSGVVVASNTLLEMILLVKGNLAYSLFFYAQGRVYALTLLTNFLLGIPGRPTLTLTTAPGTGVTNVAFRVYPTSNDHLTGARIHNCVWSNSSNGIHPNLVRRIIIAGHWH
ncbi:hypothetical protein DFH07DRAFT_991023 [Mycena maculata]|uniref:DUF6534 domain-containing protein n=1 Tax=Mycena maculata TaxID=230809 RepID=A0AAD7MT11_9AGAR|nr:hypothetical protein DFH07DRAFT_991023 [Mycena maculata]